MPKISGPLMSQTAHGSLAKQVIYSKKNTGQQVRDFHYPKKNPSLKQYTQRHIIGLLTAQWQTMTEMQKAIWEGLAKAQKSAMSGFNFFIKTAENDLYSYHGLVGYWSANEKDGAILYDYSGNNNHATLGPTYPTTCPERIDSFRQNYGKALFYSGPVKYGLVPHSATLDILDEISIEFYCNDYWSFIHRYICAKNLSSEVDVDYGVFSNIETVLYLKFAETEWRTDIFAGYIDWPHIVLVAKSNEYRKAYLNGKLVKTIMSCPVFSNHSYDLVIGARRSATGFTGQLRGDLDELRIYKRALGETEIQKHYEILKLDKQRQNRVKFEL